MLFQKFYARLLNTVADTQLTTINIPRTVGVVTITSVGATTPRIRIFNGDVATGTLIFDANPPTIGTFGLDAYCDKGIAAKLEGGTSPVVTVTHS